MGIPDSRVGDLLKARSDLDVQLRQHKSAVTVVFTDVVGSTSYFEKYGDTAGLAMIHRQTDVTISRFQSHGGRIIKTIGDSVMAEFPIPEDAVLAAVEVQRFFAESNQQLPARERIQLRVGINTGYAYRDGNDLFGDAVNVAARVTKQTGPAQILLSSSVRDSLNEDLKSRSKWAAKVTFHGKAEPENVYEVMWTDTKTYDAVREEITIAVVRGDLVVGTSVDQLSGQSETLEQVAATAEDSAPNTEGQIPQEILHRYEALEKLGSGGMGIVFKVRDRETSEVVAVKLLHPAIASDPHVLEQFKSEVRLAHRITHKNVCRVYEFNRVGAVAFISMEYIAGRSLRAVLAAERPIQLRRFYDFAKQIISGIAEAHRQGVIHRDLKPENLVLDESGSIKVMDFGIARSTKSDALLTGRIVGTASYMSPEQAEARQVDGRSDIYSTGMVFYELLTGAPAFRGDTPVSLALKQIHEQPTPPHEIVGNIPAALEDIVLRCLEKDPARRFQTADDLLLALQDVEQAMSIIPRPVSQRNRNRKILMAAATACLVFSLAVTWALGGGFSGKRTESKSDVAARDSKPVGRVIAAGIGTPAMLPNRAANQVGGLPSIAVLAFNTSPVKGEYVTLPSGIADAVSTELVSTGKYRVLERQQLQRGIEELQLNQTTLIDPATAQRLGKLIGAEYLVIGSFQVWQGQIVMNGRVLRVETAQIIAADRVSGPIQQALQLPTQLAQKLHSHAIDDPLK